MWKMQTELQNPVQKKKKVLYNAECDAIRQILDGFIKSRTVHLNPNVIWISECEY